MAIIISVSLCIYCYIFFKYRYYVILNFTGDKEVGWSGCLVGKLHQQRDRPGPAESHDSRWRRRAGIHGCGYCPKIPRCLLRFFWMWIATAVEPPSSWTSFATPGQTFQSDLTWPEVSSEQTPRYCPKVFKYRHTGTAQSFFFRTDTQRLSRSFSRTDTHKLPRSFFRTGTQRLPRKFFGTDTQRLPKSFFRTIFYWNA